MSNTANTDNARESVLAATLAALGKSAPEPGSPRYGHLQVQIAVLLEDGKDDNPRFLSGPVRDALMQAIAEDRRGADDIVKYGHHGLAYASDEHLLGAAEEVQYEGIVAGSYGVGAPLGQRLLEELSGPQAVDMILRGSYNPQRPDLGLLGSLDAELTRRGLPNPYRAAIAEMAAEAMGASEVDRG